MVELQGAQSSSATSFEKDLEIQSHSPRSSSTQRQSDISKGEKAEEIDVEAEPDEFDENDPHAGGYAGPGDGSALGTRATRTSTKSSWKDPGPPPDGGWIGWTQAALCHLVILNTWGFINSFGVFQTYYVTALGRPPSDISWIGSFQVFLLFFIGTFTGRLTDAGYFRQVFLAGSSIAVFGLFMASLSTTYWQVFLAQGVCCGVGSGFLFCPSLSLLSTYFSKKRSLAIGIAAAGSATGGMVFPAMVQQLLPKIGFPWTMRALGFIQLGCLIICNIGIKPRVPPRKTGALVDWASFKEITYVLFATGMFFVFWGVYFAFYYLASYSRSVIGLSYPSSVNLLITLNGVGVVGRVIPNFIADRYTGPLNMLLPSALITACLSFCWIAVSSVGGLYAWAIIYGISASAIQSLFPATLSSLTTNLRMQGTRMGMIFTIVSFAVLTGPPIAGQLIQRKDGGYLYAQVFAGSVMIVGCGFLVAAKLSKDRKLGVKM
ncbi:Aspyridones efflux apdF [Hyphodiscus hymeniophilus]|uniref:Aspyridones efflux apdF n=1 Tax=Hyphodiscus hymeniophilus TaxID=353542 RepID=A0A9P6VFQ0_9HELO|nr:Aspyridones efflux apdF [Hyphodiscus hymeniophilus]